MPRKKQQQKPQKYLPAAPVTGDDPQPPEALPIPKKLGNIQPLAKNSRFTTNHSAVLAHPRSPQPFEPEQSHEAGQTQFHSIDFKKSARSARNILPPILHGLEAIEPADNFRLFFTQSLVNGLVANTNTYATENQAGGAGRSWKAVTRQDINRWSGIIIMGVHNPPAMAEYWRKDSLNRTHPTCEYMSQTQFEQIRRYLQDVAPPDIELDTPARRTDAEVV